jgi:hypothetical protein
LKEGKIGPLKCKFLMPFFLSVFYLPLFNSATKELFLGSKNIGGDFGPSCPPPRSYACGREFDGYYRLECDIIWSGRKSPAMITILSQINQLHGPINFVNVHFNIIILPSMLRSSNFFYVSGFPTKTPH